MELHITLWLLPFYLLHRDPNPGYIFSMSVPRLLVLVHYTTFLSIARVGKYC